MKIKANFKIEFLLTTLSFVTLVVGHFSLNIFFVFIPFFKNIFSRIKLPKLKIYRLSLFYFLSIGIFGFLYYVFLGNFSYLLPLRQLISFILFISIFFLSLFPDLPLKRELFFKSIFLASFVNLFVSLYRIYTNGLDVLKLSNTNYGDFKNMASLHNTGFIFSFALIAALFDETIIKNTFLRITILISSFLGLIFTFSRSAILSFLFGLVSIFILKILDFIKNKKIKLSFLTKKYKFKIYKFFTFGFISLAFLTLLVRFKNLLFNNFSNIFFILDKLGGAELDRVERWNFAFNFVLNKSLTGTNFLGVWSVSDYGSMHSSFFDILLRTGFIGLIFYFLILFDLIKFYFQKKDYIIISGIFCLVGYGLTYEVMLWPAGLCFLSFLLFFRVKNSYNIH